MWENETLERARQAFAAQFEEAGEAVVYRQRRTGEPIPVNVWERDALVYDFERRTRWLYTGVVLLVVGTMLGTWAAASLARLRPTLMVVVLIVAPIGLAYYLLQRWIWAAPERLIARRGPDAVS